MAEQNQAEVTFTGTGWKAWTIVTLGEAAIHFYVQAEGYDLARVNEGLCVVKEIMTKGRGDVHWRAEPMAETQTDFLSDDVKHRGFMRFSIQPSEA